jgi:hypothetical protein
VLLRIVKGNVGDGIKNWEMKWSLSTNQLSNTHGERVERWGCVWRWKGRRFLPPFTGTVAYPAKLFHKTLFICPVLFLKEA